MSRVKEIQSEHIISRFFHVTSHCFQALTTPSLYRCLQFKTSKKFISYAEQVTDQPILGSYLEALYYKDGVTQDANALAQLASIFVHMTNLKSFQDSRIERAFRWQTVDFGNSKLSPWAVFASLAEHTGRTLENMDAIGFGTPKRVESPALWASFERLRELTWCCEVAFQHKAVVPHDALPMLQKLTLRNYDSSFIHVLNKMECVACILAYAY